MSTGLAGLNNEEFEISGATFRIKKLKGIAGFDLLELIRTSIAGSSMNSLVGDGEDETEVGSRMMSAIMSIDSTRVREILAVAFSNIEVKLPALDRFAPLSTVGPAVDDLIEPIDNYEIIVRFIAVNFTKSTVALMSRLGLNLGAVEAASIQ